MTKGHLIRCVPVSVCFMWNKGLAKVLYFSPKPVWNLQATHCSSKCLFCYFFWSLTTLRRMISTSMAHTTVHCVTASCLIFTTKWEFLHTTEMCHNKVFFFFQLLTSWRPSTAWHKSLLSLQSGLECLIMNCWREKDNLRSTYTVVGSCRVQSCMHVIG